jgi:hypothetical protein
MCKKKIFSICIVFLTSMFGASSSVESDLLLQLKEKKASYKINRNDYIVSITIPKCGTHLILKCLDLFRLHDVQFAYKHTFQHERLMPIAIQKNARLAPNYFRGKYDVDVNGPWPIAIMKAMKSSVSNRSRLVSDHWPYTKEADILFSQVSTAKFFMYRDPRDMIVSMAYYVQKGPDGVSIELEKIIWDFIDGRKKSFVPWGVGINELYPLLYDYGVTKFYSLFLPWLNTPGFLAVKFENLIGPLGGGCLVQQSKSIHSIAKHLGAPCSDEQVDFIAKNLFGASSTFREGKIGTWRKHFTEEMIACYKKVPGACKLLIDLGYEQNEDW